jgi:hypothetical protein
MCERLTSHSTAATEHTIMDKGRCGKVADESLRTQTEARADQSIRDQALSSHLISTKWIARHDPPLSRAAAEAGRPTI